MSERNINGITALEMTMRDVLDGMEELSTASGFNASLAGLEILAIEPPQSDAYDPPSSRPYAA